MRRVVIAAAVVLVLGLGLCGVASAQTGVVINPTTVEFDPSADHARMGLDGQPLVARYELRIFAQGAAQPITVYDLGKPEPGGNGKITIVNRNYFLTALLMNVPYTGRVSAIGPTGEGVSDPSNPFGNQGPPAAAGSVVVRQ